jgi:transcriptional regulator with XRE-family HTH domain
LSQIETGKVNPSFSSMQNIADALNVPLSQLILKNEGTVENDLESIIDKQEWENGIPKC